MKGGDYSHCESSRGSAYQKDFSDPVCVAMTVMSVICELGFPSLEHSSRLREEILCQLVERLTSVATSTRSPLFNCTRRRESLLGNGSRRGVQPNWQIVCC